jgi:protein-S-isoprenylcysteine O-methyltransferase Ste14
MTPYLLLTYFIIYIAVAFLWRSWRVHKQTGTNPFMLATGDDAHAYIGRAMAVCIGLIAVMLVLTALPFGAMAYFAPLTWMQIPLVTSIGWALLAVSLAWTVIAQKQMGNSWRIGIPQGRNADVAAPLVTTGVFSRSRNPIFLGMCVTLAGLFFVMPNAGTLAAAITGIVLMQIQVRLEEVFLVNAHGEMYRAYCERVHRWL